MQIRSLFHPPIFYFTCLLMWVGISTPVKALPAIVDQVVLYLEQNDIEKAQVVMDTILQDPILQKEASVWYYQGVIYEQLMKKNIVSDSALWYLDQALDAYHSVLRAEHSNEQFSSFSHNNIQGLWVYFINRAVQYYKMESFEDALEQVAIAEKIDKTPVRNTLYKAIIAHDAEKYDLAISCYQTYIQQEKGEPPVYRSLAQLLVNQPHQPMAAETVLDTAMQAYPWDLGLLGEKYTLDLQDNKIEAKKAQLEATAVLLPSFPLVTEADSLQLAIVYYRLAYLHTHIDEEWQQAIDYYQKVLTLLPKQVDTLAQLGLIYYNKGAALVQATLDLEEDAFQAEGANRLEQANQFLKQALPYFEKVHRLERRNIYLLKTLHTLYTYFKNTDKAMQVAKKLKKLKGGPQLLAG